MKIGLFIGRFQPFHLGHLDGLNQVLKECEKVIIGIGSAEDSFLPENPFTTRERFQMIEKTLKEKKIPENRYNIIPIRNIQNYALWTRHVELLTPPFDTVYSGSFIVRKLFNEYGKCEVKKITMQKNINATSIRKKMLSDENWQKFVPKVVADFILKIDGINRMKNIQ
ncbi:nicotinamide-nucleotide adenylyltransferase [Candidatus Peregrinibacteria bacterium]|nr:nicotinamide-nucleotide adenylyltransferase [Candidatus Peregrinibacteria bacterium]